MGYAARSNKNVQARQRGELRNTLPPVGWHEERRLAAEARARAERMALASMSPESRRAFAALMSMASIGSIARLTGRRF